MNNISSVYYSRVQLLLLTFVAATMPWSIKLCNFGIIFLVAFWLLFIKKKPKLDQSVLLLITFILYFGILLVSLTIFNTSGVAIKMLETRLSFLFLPLFFLIRSDLIPSNQILIVLLIFILSVIVLTFSLFQNGFGFFYAENRIWALQDIMLLHRPYLGVYISVSIIFILTLIAHRQISFWVLTLAILVIFYFIFILYAIVAKNALAGLVLASVLSVSVYLWQAKKRFHLLIFLIFLIAVGLSQYFFNEGIRKFISGVISFSYLSYDDYHTNLIDSFNRRIEIWGCAIEILKSDQVWLKGVGLGNEQIQMDLCYLHKGYVHMGEGNFNAHSQILQDLLSAGILLGIFSFLLFVIPFLFAYRNNNYSLLTIVTIIFFFSLSESVFLRQKGVVLFIFFVCLLIHLINPSSMRTIRKEVIK